MVQFKATKICCFIKNHKGAIICALCAIVVLIRIVAGPETVASGNGYFHQVGSFGECDIKFDGCTTNATHRRHHLFGNEDYCESCWDGYGQNMFDKLSETDSTPGGLEDDNIKCRHSGCGKKPVYSDWTKRYCSEHINGTHYCRYPGCLNEISNYSTDLYCNEH